MAVSFTPLTDSIGVEVTGVEVTGVDLSASLSDGEQLELEAALARHLVMVVRDQHYSPSDLL
jgi:alpha-ketoglutarate-dependent taurine dioxygenase